MLRPRLTFKADPATRILFVRWIGDMPGRDIVDGMIGHMKTMEQPWTYDMVIDLLRFEGHLHLPESDALGQVWRELAQGRDAGRRSAIVTGDPLLAARLSMTRETFPGRTLAMFGQVQEALTWLATAQPSAA